ncbi:PrsW family intramembrane metalloprotease [Candidatus Bipolaricaulota bacterium]|nr:PrsW family intramembrane metalloprotease [Candidatus Bipolaricaulota bacterium]
MQLFLQSAYLSSALSLIYIALLYRSHPFRRLPLVSVFATFIVGMLAVVPVMLVYRLIPGLKPEGMLGALLLAPLVEESVKLFAFAWTARRLGYPSLIEPLDYAIAFGILGVGFAIYEDFWYIFGHSYPSWISGDISRFSEVFRWMAYARSFPGHILFNALAGFFIGWGLCQSEGKVRWTWYASAFLVAAGTHSLFNLVASQRGTLLLWSLVVAYAGIFLVLRRHVLEVSPFAAIREYIDGGRSVWNYKLSPVGTLFAEGFSWPRKTKPSYLAFYPVTLSLIVLFPVLVICIYFMHRLLSIGVAA